MSFIRTALVASVVAILAVPATAQSINILLPNLSFPDATAPEAPGTNPALSSKSQ